MASNLPPGCTNAMIDEWAGGNMPPQCEECELYNEDLRTCPYEGKEEYCHIIALVTECANCKKPLCKVQGAFKPEEIACGWDIVFCCSKECAKEIQDKINKEEEMEIEDEEGIVEAMEAE